jgi:Flp pilus assembly protein TadG
MTGQAQTLAYGTTNPGSYSQEDFGKAVCARVQTLFDCTKMTVDVKKYADFASVDNSPPITVDPVTGARNLDTSKVTYVPGGPNCIIAVSLYYQWPINVAIYGDMSNLANHKRLLAATAVFRNEPYGGANAC